MKRIFFTVLSCAFLFLFGCSSGNLQSAYVAHTVGLNVASGQRITGTISDKQQSEVIAPARDSSKIMLDVVYDTTPDPTAKLADVKALDDAAVERNRALDPVANTGE